MIPPPIASSRTSTSSPSNMPIGFNMRDPRESPARTVPTYPSPATPILSPTFEEQQKTRTGTQKEDTKGRESQKEQQKMSKKEGEGKEGEATEGAQQKEREAEKEGTLSEVEGKEQEQQQNEEGRKREGHTIREDVGREQEKLAGANEAKKLPTTRESHPQEPTITSTQTNATSESRMSSTESVPSPQPTSLQNKTPQSASASNSIRLEITPPSQLPVPQSTPGPSTKQAEEVNQPRMSSVLPISVIESDQEMEKKKVPKTKKSKPKWLKKIVKKFK
ncbi:hypothetical protein HDV00_004935 [Rhizophlyctis rosea]|nr:hypothetical protein HDV00_004935 [Rhizophlyctis rosea]